MHGRCSRSSAAADGASRIPARSPAAYPAVTSVLMHKSLQQVTPMPSHCYNAGPGSRPLFRCCPSAIALTSAQLRSPAPRCRSSRMRYQSVWSLWCLQIIIEHIRTYFHCTAVPLEVVQHADAIHAHLSESAEHLPRYMPCGQASVRFQWQPRLANATQNKICPPCCMGSHHPGCSPAHQDIRHVDQLSQTAASDTTLAAKSCLLRS